MESTGRNISDIELNNTQTVKDLLKLLRRPETTVLEARKRTLEEELKATALPPNMHWVPSKYTLIRAIETAQAATRPSIEGVSGTQTESNQ
jgi:hypothetical protein